MFVSVTMVGTINIQPNLRSGVLFFSGEMRKSGTEKGRKDAWLQVNIEPHSSTGITVISGLFAYF